MVSKSSNISFYNWIEYYSQVWVNDSSLLSVRMSVKDSLHEVKHADIRTAREEREIYTREISVEAAHNVYSWEIMLIILFQRYGITGLTSVVVMFRT